MNRYHSWRIQLITSLIIFSLSALSQQLCAKEGKVVEYSPRFENLISKNLNLGVVTLDETYQIYRSKKLGRSGLYLLDLYLESNKLPFPKTIVYMNDEGYEPFYQFAIEEYKLQDHYLYQFYHGYDYDYRTYLDGRNPYSPQDNIDDRFFTHLIDRHFGLATSPQYEQVEGGIDAFFRIMKIVLDPEKQPVLFHCWGGKHRTGIIAMAIRYLQGPAWTTPLDGPPVMIEGVPFQLNAAQKEYIMHNKSSIRIENFQFMKQLSLDPRFIALKEEWASSQN
jgi:hypothetical protein